MSVDADLVDSRSLESLRLVSVASSVKVSSPNLASRHCEIRLEDIVCNAFLDPIRLRSALIIARSFQGAAEQAPEKNDESKTSLIAVIVQNKTNLSLYALKIMQHFCLIGYLQVFAP